ncbi:uncharacterized protein VTP21DRAFT_138 [Calcarisporiella thermophila]|uniref:uncharacterized protein n=1 Tax=Calcarisporiella thermophila TaxID=911321 RepID=UPI00374296BF
MRWKNTIEVTVGTKPGLLSIPYVITPALLALVSLALAQQDRPRFQLPFQCNTRWQANTRNNHSPQNAVDFNRFPEDFNDPILASFDGRVSKVQNLGRVSYGLHVIVDHGNGWSTLYAHLNSVNVRQGQQLRQGQELGRLGTTGFSTGPHLHYEQRFNNRDVRIAFDNQPLRYFANSNLVSRNCGGGNGNNNQGNDNQGIDNQGNNNQGVNNQGNNGRGNNNRVNGNRGNNNRIPGNRGNTGQGNIDQANGNRGNGNRGNGNRGPGNRNGTGNRRKARQSAEPDRPTPTAEPTESQPENTTSAEPAKPNSNEEPAEPNANEEPTETKTRCNATEEEETGKGNCKGPFKVKARGGKLNMRSGASVSAKNLGQLSDGDDVKVCCQTRGSRVSGTFGSSTIWSRLDNGAFVSDAFIDTGSNDFVMDQC